MYSNNILNFQESTTILNAGTKKKSGNLSYAPRTYTWSVNSNEKKLNQQEPLSLCLLHYHDIYIYKMVLDIYIYIKWYLMPPCLTLSIIRYGSRVK